MTTLYLILYIVAAVLFALAALLSVRPAGPRPVPNLIALGLLAWVLVPLIVTARNM